MNGEIGPANEHSQQAILPPQLFVQFNPVDAWFQGYD